MGTVNAKNAAEVKNETEDLTLTGPNTELLSVRIPKGLYNELDTLARTSKRQFPELLREMLWFHAFPSYVQASLREMKKKHGGAPNEASAMFYLGLPPQLTMYRHQVDKVLKSCEAVKELEKQALALKAKLERLEEEAKAGWQEFLDSTTT